MRRRAKLAAVAALGFGCLTFAGLITVPALMIMATSTGTSSGDSQPVSCSTDLPAGNPVILTDDDQRANAKVIIQTGQGLHVPPRGLIVGVATAMQESKLHNLDYGDRDSLGLFQQRSGWGAVAEREDPASAATMFFTGGHGGQPGLLDIHGWQSMTVGEAAQAVQVSAFPLAYAQWESLATTTVQQVTGGSAPAPCADDQQQAGLPDTAAGKMVTFALAQQGKPYVWGATGPDSFDCSGLVVYSWRQAGYRLTIRTAAQMYLHSTPIAEADAEPGDLAYSEFGPTGAGHVEIVVKSGELVEAPHTGDVVKLDSYRAGLRFGRLKSSVMVAVG